ncbi:hypothetical protein AB832_07445 [Flavobacteriaceae bacterium (ex Bugula neritina AB1)]|nr:hypothetical protein AB832_07445 [Flavobacteriaceae bacterium (ex Bugula neritina AB1)]
MKTVEIELLKHQYELLSDTTTKVLGLVSGFGGGKTYSVARKALHLATLNAGIDGIITEPNHPLLTQILIPEVKDALSEFGYSYTFNKVDSIFYVRIQGKETRIICKSMENYDRLIGINAAWVVMDEFDTAKENIAYNAYLKLLGRIRAGNVRQMVVVSTPEGFKAFYRVFVKESDNNKRLIKAKTTDNKHLPADYIELLRESYPPQLIQAYLNGEFVNLSSGTVYNQFDRVLNHCDDEITGHEPLYIGMDFNVGNMSAVIHVKRNGQPRAVDELVGGVDTPSIIKTLKERYPKHVVIIYPDASGNSRKSNDASQTDITQLKQAGFRVIVNASNPSVKDRVNTVNAMFCNSNGERRYLVNTNKCPVYTECLEQQIYDKNGDPDKLAGNDHLNDAAGYHIVKDYPINKPVSKSPMRLI